MNNLLQASICFYSFIAMTGACLLLYVLYLALADMHLNRTDKPSVIKGRKRAFFADAIFIALTVGFREYWIVHPVVALVASGFIVGGAWILVVNVISLRDRDPTRPPRAGYGYHTHPARAHWWRRI